MSVVAAHIQTTPRFLPKDELGARLVLDLVLVLVLDLVLILVLILGLALVLV